MNLKGFFLKKNFMFFILKPNNRQSVMTQYRLNDYKKIDAICYHFI